MSLTGFLHARRKRNTIRRYITDLGPMLSRRYGKSETYSPQQVREVIQDNGLSAGAVEYALVLYSTPEQFEADQGGRGGPGYWDLRAEIVGYNFRHGRVSSGGEGVGGDHCTLDGGPGYSHGGHGGHF